ncbi:uncharacterized protein LOC106175104 isoform X3 [Lingula anatina]|uniref:Uncharacterized protein LOC106175104 isoform X3 n=1 Tax=Lingula anatina TaxID=7574 RepID=A0A1S3JPU1_LINAN|nr:uncharacterized protein LOC106175104 isoform X3 [Lingula anatina]|eukprot:XP_013412390.1 uncharacterized protein LOC106175104 isoform X3 [Lingula anatina]
MLKLSPNVVQSEWALILMRCGIFSTEEMESELDSVICPAHRYKLGINWRAGRTCHHPLHRGKRKPSRPVSPALSREIMENFGVLLPVGSGICPYCRNAHKEHMEKKFPAQTLQVAAADQPFPTEVESENMPEGVDEGEEYSDVGEEPMEEQDVGEGGEPQPGTSGLQVFSDVESSSSADTQHPVGQKRIKYGDYVYPSSTSGSSDSPVRPRNIPVDLDASWAPTPMPPRNQDLDNLNQFLKRGGVNTVAGQLKKPLEDATERTKRYYKQKTREAINLVLTSLAPGQEEDLWLNFQLPEKDRTPALTSSLVECYQAADSWDVRRQILSLLVRHFHIRTHETYPWFDQV